MFEVICTGKNLCYGKKGQKKLLNDNHTLSALKNDWITDKFKWVGRKQTAAKIKFPIAPMPFQRINIEQSLKSILTRHKRIILELENMTKTIDNLNKIIKKGD